MKNNKKVMSDMVAVARPKKAPVISLEKPVVVRKPSPRVERYVETQEEVNDFEKTPRAPRQEVPRVGCALWFTGIICLGLLALVIGGVIARTEIVVTPQQYSGTVDMSATLAQGGVQGDIRFYTAMQSFSDKQIIPTQTVVARESRATGTVRFYNSTGKSKTIPAKTVIKSSTATGVMVAYQTKTAITVPAAKNKQPGQKDVGIIAVDVGAQANIGLNDFVLNTPIPGILIRSVTEMTGGAQGSDKIADPALIAAARETLGQSLTISEEMIQRLKEELPKDMIVLPITFADTVPVVTLESHHEDGVHVVARKTVTVIMVKRADLARLIGDRLSAPKGELLTISSLEGLSIASGALASPQNVPKTLSVRITGTARIAGLFENRSVQASLKGLSQAEARSAILAYPEVASVDIHMIPFWRRILPLDAEKISVTVTNP
jgi:hypothetical protein